MNSSVYVWPTQLTIDELRAFAKEHALGIAGLSALFDERARLSLTPIAARDPTRYSENPNPSRWKLTLDTDGVDVTEATRFTFGVATCVSHHSFKTVLSLARPEDLK